MTLTLTPSGDAYVLDGARLPRVTTVIAPLVDWASVPSDVLELARERGVAVHKACELFDLDDLDEDSVAPAVRPYLYAWIKFRRDTGFSPRLVEQRLHHPLHRYAGTFDVAGIFPDTPPGTLVLIDRKATAAIHVAVRVQTAAYAELLRAVNPGLQSIRRFSIQLRKDGTYRLSAEYRDPDDWKIFVSLLNVARFKEKHSC